MNCYYHSEKTAVGICKSCGRGLCVDCAADIQDGLACKGRCEERAQKINSIINNNSRVLAVSNTQLRRNMIFMVVTGLLFAILGGIYMSLADAGSFGGIFVGLGVVFIVRGIASYTRAARYPSLEKNAK